MNNIYDDINNLAMMKIASYSKTLSPMAVNSYLEKIAVVLPGGLYVPDEIYAVENGVEIPMAYDQGLGSYYNKYAPVKASPASNRPIMNSNNGTAAQGSPITQTPRVNNTSSGTVNNTTRAATTSTSTPTVGKSVVNSAGKATTNAAGNSVVSNAVKPNVWSKAWKSVQNWTKNNLGMSKKLTNVAGIGAAGLGTLAAGYGLYSLADKMFGNNGRNSNRTVVYQR